MTNTYKISSSTELMHNYKQFELFDQEDLFKAVQTSDGHSMFFGQSSDGRLFLVLEQSGIGTGWKKYEITTSLKGKVKTFAISQNHTTGAVNLAVVMTDSADPDKLYLCMDQSNSDLGWVSKPINWKNMADDRVGSGKPTLKIDDVHLSESSSGKEYVIADTDDGKGFVARYWINTTATPVWNSHPLAFNISAATPDKSLMGRKAKELVDGIYTFGEENNVPQFVYTPLYNPFAPTSAPNPTNFDLSGTGISKSNGSFATCKALSGADNATDIFVAGNGSLYYLAAEDQEQLAKPQLVFQNTMLNVLHELQASVHKDQVVVWGLNDADQVFYLSCNKSQLHDASAWSVPLPLMTNTSQISQYIDKVKGGLTIFANAGEGKLLKAMQDPQSSQWVIGQIELPVSDVKAKATKEKSYTTSIHVTDQNNNPCAEVDITLTPNGRTNVYINNVYYALNGEPITVKTDKSGTLTIVEWIDGLTGTNFNVAAGDSGQAVAINPANIPLSKMENLGSVSALEGAQITNHDGTTKSLLPKGLSEDDKKALAQSISNLNQAHDGIMKKEPLTGRNAEPNASFAMSIFPNPFKYIKVLCGDLLEGIKHFGEYTIKLVKDEASEVWHFIVEVGDKAYGFIVDTVEKVAGALKSIWDKIVKGFEDLWNYLKFLFEWKDFLLTRDVFKQTIKIFMHRIGEDLQKGKKAMDDAITSAEGEIQKWVKDPAAQNPALGDSNHTLNASLQGKPPSKGVNSAPGQLLKNHFIANVHNSTVTEQSPNVSSDPTWSGLTDLHDFIDKEQKTINDLKQQIMSLLMSASGKQANPDLETILKKIVADVAIGAMDLFKMAADKVMDFLTLLIDEAIKLLDTPIHIPVLSDILEDLFDIKLPSILDVLCLVVAVPATIEYKIANGHAPYVSDDNSIYTKITKAQTYAELQANFQQTGDKITLKQAEEALLFQTFYIAGGLSTIIKEVLDVIDEETEDGASTVLSTPKTVISLLASISIGLGSLFSMSTGIKNDTVKTFAGIVGKLSHAKTLGFGVATKVIPKVKGISGAGPLKEFKQQISMVESGVDCILGAISLIPQGYHIVEIIADGDIKKGSGVLGIMDSTQGITTGLGKIVGLVALLDEDEETKQVVIAIQGVLTAITGEMKIAEAVMEPVLLNKAIA